MLDMDRGTQALLRRFHAQPGKTPAMLADWRTEDDRTSYEVMVEELRALPRDTRIVDLACGNGHLLGLLAQAGFHTLSGVDQSAEELAQAREHLGGRATLYCQDVRTLPWRDASVDVVVCHWALMILEPLDEILAEVARVLVPGGELVAVVNRFVVDPVNEVHRKWLHRTTVEAGLPRVKMGDPRAYSPDGLTELARAHGFDRERITIRDFETHTRVEPQTLWASLRLMYDVFQLPPSAEAILERRLLSAWKPHLDEAGRVSSTMGQLLLRCPQEKARS